MGEGKGKMGMEGMVEFSEGWRFGMGWSRGKWGLIVWFFLSHFLYTHPAIYLSSNSSLTLLPPLSHQNNLPTSTLTQPFPPPKNPPQRQTIS